MSTKSVVYTLTLNSNVTKTLKDNEAQALKFEGVLDSLNSKLRMFGLGFAGHLAIEGIKDWVQGAAEYQDATNRIRFASDTLYEGAENVKFIRSEVDKFKIPLQSTTDAYGKFLAMVQGSGMASERVRKLHDDILLIGKIKHLDAGQLDAGVMNLGKMLEAGALDARHLRPLEMQLSGIGKFIADELGVSVHELAQLRNKGKLTDIDPMVVVEAIRKQAESLKQHLPEALDSLQSHLNETSTAWLDFKNELSLTLKPELVSVTEFLRDASKWLKDNKDNIASLVRVLPDLIKLYLTYKTATLAINTAKMGYNSIMKVWNGNAIQEISTINKKTSSYAAEAASVRGLVSEIQRLNYVQNAQNGAFITNASGVTMANTVGNRYMIAQQSARFAQTMALARGINQAQQNISAINQSLAMQNASVLLNRSVNSKVPGLIGAAGSFAAGAVPVVVTMLTVAAAASIADAISSGANYKNATPDERVELAKKEVLDNIRSINSLWFKDNDRRARELIGGTRMKFFDETPETLLELKKLNPDIVKDREYVDKIMYALKVRGDRTFIDLAHKLGFWATEELSQNPTLALMRSLGGGKNIFQDAMFLMSHSVNPDADKNLDPLTRNIIEAGKSKEKEHKGGWSNIGLDTKKDKIKGNSVTNITIQIGEMIGMKVQSQTIKNGKDSEKEVADIGVKMVQQLTQVVNDSQQVGNRF